MQPYFLPYIGYFQTMATADEYVIYDVQFIKGGWINRNNILIGGRKARFTMSLKNRSANKLINQTEISDDFVKLQRTFAMNYARAPYLSPTLSLLDSILQYDERNLARFVGHSLEVIANHLGLKCHILYSSSYPQGQDLRGQDRVIEICTRLGATRYVNAIGTSPELVVGLPNTTYSLESRGPSAMALRSKPLSWFLSMQTKS